MFLRSLLLAHAMHFFSLDSPHPNNRLDLNHALQHVLRKCTAGQNAPSPTSKATDRTAPIFIPIIPMHRWTRAIGTYMHEEMELRFDSPPTTVHWIQNLGQGYKLQSEFALQAQLNAHTFLGMAGQPQDPNGKPSQKPYPWRRPKTEPRQSG